jgi:hypothetical protein
MLHQYASQDPFVQTVPYEIKRTCTDRRNLMSEKTNKRGHTMKKLMTALAVIAMAAASQAALIAHEGFNYTAAANLNTLPGATGGTTWPATGLATTNWSGGTVTSSGLSYTGIQSGGNAAQPDNGGTVRFRNIGTSTLQNKTFWFSVLFNAGNASTAVNTTERFILGTYGTSSGYGLGFEVKDPTGTGVKALNTFYATGGGSSAQVDSTATQSLTVGNTYLVIGKVTLTSAGTGSESLDLWLNPASFASEGALGTANISQSGNFAMGWDYSVPNMAVAIQGSADTILFDEIRIGDNVADVIPEPATFALFGLAGGSILMYRRSRKSASEDQE